MNSEDKEYRLSVEVILGLTDAQPRLYSFLLKRLACKEQVQEVLQNVNLAICKKAETFSPGSDFMAWAFAIARIELMSFRKVLSRDKLVFSDALIEKISRLDSDLNEAIPVSERKSALEICLEQLSPEHMTLVTRRYTESISVKAIAGDLGRTTNSVSLLLHRIRERLLGCINRRLASESDG